MNTLLERWCESRPWHRVLCWCLGSLLAGLVAWGALLRPVDRQCAEQQRQLIENVSTNASLWPVVRKGPFLPDAAKARELALDAEWQAIPELFSRLAQQDVQIAAFTISPQGTALRLQLELEHAK